MTDDTKQERQISIECEPRLPYQRPLLISFGRVSELTQSGSLEKPEESQGQGCRGTPHLKAGGNCT